jgi:2-polyprenyl-6-methoxyphenol hydroxylase-like FAD-dependent oxidoreductase
MSSWARFYHPLRALFPDARYHFGHTVQAVETDVHRASVILADGSRLHADLVVAADGVRSTVRQCLLPEIQPRYAGYVAWRAQLPETMVPRDVYDDIWDHQVFCLPDGEMMLSHPMPGADDDVRPGHRRYNFVWYHPVDGECGLPALCTDASGHCHGTSIPHPLIRPEVIKDIRAVAHEVLAPQIARTFSLAPQCFFQAITDLESPQLQFGRTVLLGDAAFVARPHVGMGVAKAALDAQRLADEILAADHDLSVALPKYEAARLAFGRRAVARARWLGAHLEARNKPPNERTEAEQHQDPKVVMVEVGKQIREIPELAELTDFGSLRSRS